MSALPMLGAPLGGPRVATSSEVDVLYIAGSPRSGSTVLALLLGSLPGLFAAGEMRFVWRQLSLPGRCGCGRTLGACDVWRTAFDRAGVDVNGADVLARTSRQHSRLAAVAMCALSAAGGRVPRRFRQHLQRTAPLYSALATLQDAHTIVDSSKSPSYALLLTSVPQLRVHVVHLLRDPRAVAYSFLREGVAAGRGRRVVLAARHAAKWAVWNAATELLLRRRAVTYTRLRYESFADSPGDAARDLLQQSAGSAPVSYRVTPVLPASNHTAFGNGLRVDHRPSRVIRDDAWRCEMGRLDQLTVLALTWPLLRRYGYRVRRDG